MKNAACCSGVLTYFPGISSGINPSPTIATRDSSISPSTLGVSDNFDSDGVADRSAIKLLHSMAAFLNASSFSSNVIERGSNGFDFVGALFEEGVIALYLAEVCAEAHLVECPERRLDLFRSHLAPR